MHNEQVNVDTCARSHTSCTGELVVPARWGGMENRLSPKKKRWKNDPVLNVTRQGMAKAEPAWGWAVTQNSTDPQ